MLAVPPGLLNVPLFVAGTPDEGSKGLTMFAPLIPHTVKEILSEADGVVIVMVSPESGVEATAHHSLPSPKGSVALSVNVRDA